MTAKTRRALRGIAARLYRVTRDLERIATDNPEDAVEILSAAADAESAASIAADYGAPDAR